MPQKQPAAMVQRWAPSGMEAVADEASGAMERRVEYVKGRIRRARRGGRWKAMAASCDGEDSCEDGANVARR